MIHTTEIDGERRDIDIRPMDEGFIVYCKMFQAPLLPADVPEPKPGEPGYVVQEFFRKQIRYLGSCMILAWDGDGVIGKMHFTTRELHEAIGGPECWDEPYCYCVDHEGFAPRLETLSDADLAPLLASPSRTLRVLCFNIGHIDPRWHGHGIAKAMLNYLKQWAPERGWRRIEAWSCADITPTNVVGEWMLRRGALERQGFRVVEEEQVPAVGASNRLKRIDAFLSGDKDSPKGEEWYAAHVHKFAADPAWRSEYAKDYLMAFDL